VMMRPGGLFGESEAVAVESGEFILAGCPRVRRVAVERQD
jgi:hypothetical protein